MRQVDRDVSADNVWPGIRAGKLRHASGDLGDSVVNRLRFRFSLKVRRLSTVLSHAVELGARLARSEWLEGTRLELTVSACLGW